MILTERTYISKSNTDFDKIMGLCGLAKNLYNTSLYRTRQHYFKTKKFKDWRVLRPELVAEDNVDYRGLPAKLSGEVVKSVGNSFSSFFGLIKLKQKGSDIKVSLPKYLPKEGKYKLVIPKDAISKSVVHLDEGLFKYSICPKSKHVNLKALSKIPYVNLKQIRYIPQKDIIIQEVIYEIEDTEMLEDNGRYASIDLGVNNLMTLVYNTGEPPIIYNGKPIKSINQFYNKRKSKLQSALPKNSYSSHRLRKLGVKRNNKINDYFHKATRDLVNQLVSNNISRLVIGYNKGWKQDIKLGRRNNQIFVGIPFNSLVNMLAYKCRMAGIEVVKTEESYTSKCSFISGEELKYSKQHLGQRITRGLYRDNKSGKVLNSDVNGAFNIMRKVSPVGFRSQGVEGVAVHPLVTRTFGDHK